MRQIDTSSATAVKPTPPAAGTAGFFQDTDGAGGTVVPAWYLNSLQDEIINAIIAGGLTPDKADDTQLATAIAAIGANQGYLHVRDEKASGTDGGTFTSGAWQTRTLNTSKTNTISGASLGSNQITLPSGTYRIKASAPATPNKHTAAIYDTTGTAFLVIGTAENADSTNQTRSFVSGVFTLASPSVIELQHRCNSTGTTTGFGAACTFGVVEVYAEVEIWKIA